MPQIDEDDLLRRAGIEPLVTFLQRYGDGVNSEACIKASLKLRDYSAALCIGYYANTLSDTLQNVLEHMTRCGWPRFGMEQLILLVFVFKVSIADIRNLLTSNGLSQSQMLHLLTTLLRFSKINKLYHDLDCF